jgi:hypothetical protein
MQQGIDLRRDNRPNPRHRQNLLLPALIRDAATGNYGPAYPRLQKVKGQYDPRNLFKLNSNVLPAA